jgi:glycosyltransferase involved in cell wall biosynthesis
VICTHRSDRYEDFAEAISSLKTQTYENLEIVVVVDGNKELYNEHVKTGIG